MTLTAAPFLMALAVLVAQQPGVPGRIADPDSLRRTILTIEDSRATTRTELERLIAIAQGRDGRQAVDPKTRTLAIRALGRLERRDLIPVLSALASAIDTRDAAEIALVITLRAHPVSDPDVSTATDALLARTQSPVVLRHLPYATAAQVQLAETKLLALAVDPDAYGPVAAALETLARRHGKLYVLRDPALDFLRAAVSRRLPRMKPDDHWTAGISLAALMAAGRADEDGIRVGLRDQNDQVRRAAMAALNAENSPVVPAARTELTRAALRDESPFVRYEALRGWVRREAAANGCGPMLDALSDRSLHVVLAALDALGNQCLSDESVTLRLATEATPPPGSGPWHRQVHAFVSLASRSAEKASAAMPAFSQHSVWQVRMYAARAAAAMKNAQTLERLAFDAHDNVREAALPPLRTMPGANINPAFVAALARADYQLLRTAALALKDVPADKALLAVLMRALERVNADRKDTSRDTRQALLEAIRAMGGRDDLAAPMPSPRPPPPEPADLRDGISATVEMDDGRTFTLALDPELAPLACTRFLRLTRAGYYDGLTFHRVVPNFVIQGGGPGANEYSGDGPFMRDELGGIHRRGTVGISTRGRDTGDAQLFVNLVDNPRLDFEYTVFATVTHGMDVVDAVQEGARIRRIRVR